MSITNGYATLADYRGFHGINDSNDEAAIEDAIEAASRQIDGYCAQRFWQDASVVTTEFRADDRYCVQIPQGISTVTGLVVKTDDDADGTFETTWTINTDFVLEPFDAADRIPVWPYREIVAVGGYTFPMPTNRRPGVQVVAKFGWPAVPDDVKRACLIAARDLQKSKDSAFDVAGNADFGVMRVQGLSRMAQSLLAPYRRVGVG